MSERRRGSGCLIAVVVLVVLMAGGAVVADRLAKDYFEDQFAAGTQSAMGLDAPPQVSIEGWPFLLQVWHRTFERVDLTAARATLSDQDRTVRVDDVHVQLTDVRAAQDFNSFTAGHLNAAGYLAWDELTRLVGDGEVSPAGDGRIKILYNIEVFRQRIDVEASGRPVLDRAAQKLKIEDVNLRVVGMDVPKVITEEILKLRLGEIDLALPMGLRVDDLGVVERGVELQVSGTEVELQR